MKYAAILATLLLAGCSNASVAPAHPSMPRVHDMVFQRHPTKTDWLITPLKPVGGFSAWPVGLATDANHKVWVAVDPDGQGQGELAEMLMNGYQKSFPLAVDPAAIVFGPDGNFWVTSNGAISQVSEQGKEIDFPIADSTTIENQIVVGPDKALWFPQCDMKDQSGGIGRIDLQGSYTFFQSTCQGSLQVGSDGNIWAESGSLLSVMDLQGKQIAQYPLVAGGLTEGIDGSLYAIGSYNHLLGIATDGSVTDYGNNGTPFIHIGTGPDGNIWTTSFGSDHNTVTQFDVQTHQFGVSSRGPKDAGFNLIGGPDGNLWTTANELADVDIYIIQIMTAAPTDNALKVGENSPVTVSEKNYSDQWTAVSTNLQVATVTTNSQNGTFTITGMAPGKCSIAIYDDMYNSIKVKVVVN
jgi:hypothetical protein